MRSHLFSMAAVLALSACASALRPDVTSTRTSQRAGHAATDPRLEAEVVVGNTETGERRALGRVDGLSLASTEVARVHRLVIAGVTLRSDGASQALSSEQKAILLAAARSTVPPVVSEMQLEAGGVVHDVDPAAITVAVATYGEETTMTIYASVSAATFELITNPTHESVADAATVTVVGGTTITTTAGRCLVTASVTERAANDHIVIAPYFEATEAGDCDYVSTTGYFRFQSTSPEGDAMASIDYGDGNGPLPLGFLSAGETHTILFGYFDEAAGALQETPIMTLSYERSIHVVDGLSLASEEGARDLAAPLETFLRSCAVSDETLALAARARVLMACVRASVWAWGAASPQAGFAAARYNEAVDAMALAVLDAEIPRLGDSASATREKASYAIRRMLRFATGPAIDQRLQQPGVNLTAERHLEFLRRYHQEHAGDARSHLSPGWTLQIERRGGYEPRFNPDIPID